MLNTIWGGGGGRGQSCCFAIVAILSCSGKERIDFFLLLFTCSNPRADPRGVEGGHIPLPPVKLNQ
jgi:hypothetical protein